MKRVTLTTNFTDNSESVLGFAIKVLGTEVNYTLLHGFTIDYAKLKSTNSERSIEEKIVDLRAEKEQQLLAEQTRLMEKFPELSLSIEAREGIGIIAIESHCREAKPDLVVVGTHLYQSGNATANVTVATRLIGSVSVPLLVVPYYFEQDQIKNAVYAIDSIDLTSNSIKVMAHIFKRHQSELTYFQIEESEGTILEENVLLGVTNIVSANGMKMITKSGVDVVPAILAFVKENQPDILIVTAQPETYAQDFWTGSKSDQIALRLQQPLLVIPG